MSDFIPIIYKIPKTKAPFRTESPKRDITGINNFSLNILSPMTTANKQRSIFTKGFIPITSQKYKS